MAQRVRGYRRKDGTKVRSYTRSGPVAGAGAAAVAAVLVVGGAAGGLGAGSGGGGTTVRPKTGSKSAEVRAKRTTDAMIRLERKGYRVTRQASADTDCAAHSYGQVVTFFRRNPCAGVVRMSFEVRDRRRNVVLVAVASVAMPDEGGARRFRTLVDRDGTGNLTELSRERGRYRSVRFIGIPYASRRDGVVVTNVQAQPVIGRGPGTKVLRELVATALS
jgi:hypothetical protein